MKLEIKLKDPRFCNGCPLLTDQRPACGVCSLGHDGHIIDGKYYKQPDILLPWYKWNELTSKESRKYSHVKVRPKTCIENHGK